MTWTSACPRCHAVSGDFGSTMGNTNVDMWTLLGDIHVVHVAISCFSRLKKPGVQDDQKATTWSRTRIDVNQLNPCAGAAHSTKQEGHRARDNCSNRHGPDGRRPTRTNPSPRSRRLPGSGERVRVDHHCGGADSARAQGLIGKHRAHRRNRIVKQADRKGCQ
jgi:hypothetical protein